MKDQALTFFNCFEKLKEVAWTKVLFHLSIEILDKFILSFSSFYNCIIDEVEISVFKNKTLN